MSWKGRPAKPVSYDASGVGMVGSRAMSGILGVTVDSLRHMVRTGRIPSRVEDGAHCFDVREVLRVVLDRCLPIPVLKSRRSSYGEDARWAWDALSRGPWHCDVAPSGRAWLLYLDAKEDPVVRRRLSGIAVTLGGQELSAHRGVDGAPTPSPGSAFEAEPTIRLSQYGY